MTTKIAKVAIKSSFNASLLSYKIPNELKLEVGQIVEVPLRKRVVLGVVIGYESPEFKSNFELKEIIQIIQEENKISMNDLKLFDWISKYYHYPLGLLIFESLPKALKRPRELKFVKGKFNEFDFKLSEQQEEIVDKISFDLSTFKQSLIHGVTGSGKTAIYIRLINKILENKKSVLFLLPEINLTPQFLETLSEHVDSNIYSYNSTISNSDKYGLWQLVKSSSKPLVVLGVRSSIFLPIENLGIIIVDEEHDSSFKQDDRCPYNARDLALKIGSIKNIPVILGSATPCVETYYRFKNNNNLNYFKIEQRVSDSKLPEISLNLFEQKEEFWPLSKTIINEIEHFLDKNEQIIVFVNRLGHSSYLMCRSCGHQFSCPNCSNSLKYFKKRNELSCYICGYEQKCPELCPECGGLTLIPKGFGTEKVEQVLNEVFPNKIIARFDRDEINTFKELEKRLSDFHSGKIDIMVGTQMLSKGHNFKNVNLVVILGIDSQLNFPDFRANEKVFQLLKQVAGRAGRYGKDGKVIIQTYNPGNPLFKMVEQNDSDVFFNAEIPLRDLATCPPFVKIVMIYFTSKFQDRLIRESTNAAKYIDEMAKIHFESVSVLGPRPGLIEKRVNKFTWSLMLKSSNITQLHNLLNTFQSNVKLENSVSFKIDVDPYNLI